MFAKKISMVCQKEPVAFVFVLLLRVCSKRLLDAFGIYIYVCVNIYIYLLYYITRASTKRVNIEYIRIRVY